jgi:hypothetical protein
MRNKLTMVFAVLGLVAAMPAQIRVGFSSHRGVQVSAEFGYASGCRPVYAPSRVWVPGYYRTECVPATYGWVYDGCGRAHWQVIRPAYTRRVWVPGCHETRHHHHYHGRY